MASNHNKGLWKDDDDNGLVVDSEWASLRTYLPISHTRRLNLVRLKSIATHETGKNPVSEAFEREGKWKERYGKVQRGRSPRETSKYA